MWMLTLLVCMAENLRTYLQVPALIQDTSCCSALALSFGKVIFKQRLPSAPSMQNVALSSAIRKLITIQPVLQELVHCLHLSYTSPVIHAQVFEDNNSVYLLAMNHCLSDHSKHLNVKWHFFWEYVDEGHVKISKCIIDEQ